jgi:hypothetical protein
MTKGEEIELQPTDIQRRIFLSFCATVLMGVILGAVYLAPRTTWFAPRAVRRAPASGIQAGGVAARSQTALAPVVQLKAIETAPARTDPESVAPAPRSGKPVPGDTYLQMAAVDRGMAEVLVEVLRRRGFQAVVASGPTEDIFRVLVGPIEGAATLARVKADLQTAGFTSFARKHRSQ